MYETFPAHMYQNKMQKNTELQWGQINLALSLRFNATFFFTDSPDLAKEKSSFYWECPELP